MKKVTSIGSLILVLFVLSVFVSGSAIAKNPYIPPTSTSIPSLKGDPYSHSLDDLPGTGWYAEPEIQETVFNSLYASDCMSYFNENRMYLLKESITPVYALDLLHYAETGEMILIDPYIFQAKVIFSDGACAGFVMIKKLETGEYNRVNFAYSKEMSLRSGYTSVDGCISWSYADQAENIRLILDEDEIVPAQYVRCMIFTTRSPGFTAYVNDGKREGFVICNSFYSMEDLRDYAIQVRNYYQWFQKELEAMKAEWEETHPGEPFSVSGSGGSATLPETGSGISLPEDLNVLNVRDYLNGAPAITAVTDENRDLIFSFLKELNPSPKDETPVLTDPAPADPVTPADPAAPAGPASVAFFNWQTGVALGAVAILVSAAILALSRTRKKEDS